MNVFEKEVGTIFDQLPTPMQEKLLERVCGIIARCSINDAILGIEDLMVLTGRSRRFVTRLINSRHFPKPLYLIDESPRKGWQTKDVMRYFELRTRLW